MSNPYAPPDPNRPRPPRPVVPPGRQPGRPAPWGPQDRRPGEPEPEPPTPEQVRGVTRGVLLFGVLMVVTLLTTELRVPWLLLAPLAGVAAIAQGIRTVARARRIGWRGLLVPMLLGGIAISALTTFSVTTSTLVFWDEHVAYQECADTAVTVRAERECRRVYEDATDPANLTPTS